jgi:hypothetical protein
VVTGEMTPVPEERPELYRRAHDNMNFGDAVLVSLLYEFYHGDFSFVYFKSAPNTKDQMIATFRAQFGECYHKLQYEETYLWDGSIGNVALMCNPVSYDCTGFIRSTAADQQKEADKAAGAVRGKRDF